MDMLLLKLKRSLGRIRLNYILEYIPVKFLSDFESEIPAEKGYIKPKVGETTRVPRWVAYELKERGLVELVGEKPLSISDLLSIRYRLSSNMKAGISPLPQNFYRRVAPLIDSSKKNSLKARSLLSEILNDRASKILRMIAAPSPSSMLSALQPEELVLYQTVKRIFEVWKEEVLNVK